MAHTRRCREGWWGRHARLGASLIGLGLGLALSARAWPFSVDDAFIVARYARRLAQGDGYTFQPGQPSDGVTGPLWLSLLSVAARCGADVVLAGKLMGLACALGACAIAMRRSLARAGGGRRALFLALSLGSSAPLWIWAIGGLETACATLCVTAVSFGAIARPAPRLAWVAIGALLMPWLRPELLPLVLSAALWSAMRAPRARLQLSLACAAGICSVLLFRAWLFGHWLPLSAHAKPASLAHGVEYMFVCLRPWAALSIAPLLGFAWFGRRDERAISLFVAAHALAVVSAGGDWMAGARLFVPIVPLVCFAAALAWERLSLQRRTLGLALLGLVSVSRAGSALVEASAARASGELRERRLPALLTALAEAPQPIAILDIGAVGYFSDASLIDLGGLTEARIAYAPGGHVAKRIDTRWLEARAPGTIVLHSRLAPRIDREGHVRWFAGYAVERHVLSLPWVLREYRAREVVAYDRDYYYVVLTRAPTATP